MKTEIKVFGYLVAFFVPVGLLYGVLNHWKDMTGPIALFLTGALSGLIAFYLWQTAKKLPDRPEDDPDGIQADAEGDYGNFSPHSWWPLALAGGSAVVFAGLAIGWWLFIIGVVATVLAIVGWTFEYYHGERVQ